jgi:hypothetical protein
VLEAMDASSAAGRLAGPLCAMMAGPASRAESVAALTPAGRLLLAGVAGEDEALRQALEDLEGVFQRGQERKLCEGMRRAVGRCQTARPELLVRLRQLLSVRCATTDCPAKKVRSALQGTVVHDAHFFRLLARAYEHVQEAPQACAIWDRFRLHAVHEGWFPSDGPEVAALYLHMADLLRGMPSQGSPRTPLEFLRVFGGFGGFYDASQPPTVMALAPGPKAVPDCYFLAPHLLFERACAVQPDAELFSRWMDWARGSPLRPDVLDDIAERWHRAVPTDNRPLLALMYSAEDRGAFTKALKYLEQAEALDAVSPQVKRARLRLWVAKALRHMHEGNARLTAKDFAAVDGLAQSREGDRPAMLAALHWFAAEHFGDEEAAAGQEAELARLFGGPGPAAVLLGCLKQGQAKPPPASSIGPAPVAGAELVQAVGRACLLCEDFEIRMAVPRSWQAVLEQALAEGPGPHDPAVLRALAEHAQADEAREVVFAAAGAGLRLGGPTRARFLLLRGESLPFGSARRQECLDVAVELARRQRDMDLLAEAIDAARGYYTHGRAGDVEVDDALVEAVLAREAAATKLGQPVSSLESRFTRRRSGPGGRKAKPGASSSPSLFDMDETLDEEDLDDWDDEDDEDDEWDEEDLWDDEDDEDDENGFPPFSDAPPELMNLILDLFERSGGRPLSPKEMERLVSTDPALRRTFEQVVKKYGPPPGGKRR